jgi:serine protease SohB
VLLAQGIDHLTEPVSKKSGFLPGFAAKILNPPTVAVIPLAGVIKASAGARGGLSHAGVEPLIKAAFKISGLVAVALQINSPGGSPVQSTLIFSTIRRHAKKAGVPVIAFVEDAAASGGYMLALAADEIFADASSVVGSIGVVSAGFGFGDLISRYGVERRIHTAGASKSQLDPFKAEDPEDVRRLQEILDDIHRHFVDLVKDRRGDRLQDADDIFSGAFWTAGGAQRRGLIDGVGHAGDVLRQRFGEKTKIRTFEGKSPFFRRLMASSGRKIDQPPLSADEMIAEIEARALWSRYGL